MKEKNVPIVIASRGNFNQKNLSSLPDELLMKIVGFLPHSDLSAMMIVDKKFNNLTSDPALWKRYPIPAMKIVRQLHGLDILLKVLKLPKFSKLEVLDLNSILLGVLRNKNNWRFRKEELQQKFMAILKIASTLPLKRLDLSYNSLDLSYNTIGCLSYDDFLAKMVLNIQHVELNATDPTFMCRKKLNRTSIQLLDKILERVSETSVLKSISLQNCALDHLSVSAVVKLNCLTEVSLEGAHMREEQARALMEEMGKGTNVKKFDIGSEPITDAVDDGDVLENVEPEVVARALNNVEYLIYNKIYIEEEEFCDMEPEEFFDRNFLPDVHLVRFLEEMGDKATSVKKLDIEGNNLYHVSPNVMAKAFNKLEILELNRYPSTTFEHIAAILELMAIQTNVVNLKIYRDISCLSPDLVARAVVQVEQVDMLYELSRGHISAVLGQLDNNSRMKRLNLGNNDVSEIPGHVLENAVEVLGKNGGKVIVTQTNGKKYMRY